MCKLEITEHFVFNYYLILDNKSFFFQLLLVHFVTDGCKRHIHIDLSHSRSAQVDLKSLLLLSSDAFWKGRGVGQLQAHVRGPCQHLQQRRPRGRLTARASSHRFYLHSKQIMSQFFRTTLPKLTEFNRKTIDTNMACTYIPCSL